MLTWIVKISAKEDAALVFASSEMKFSSLYLSLLSSVLSLAMAQSKIRNIQYGFRTSLKQQIMYGISSVLNNVQPTDLSL